MSGVTHQFSGIARGALYFLGDERMEKEERNKGMGDTRIEKLALLTGKSGKALRWGAQVGSWYSEGSALSRWPKGRGMNTGEEREHDAREPADQTGDTWCSLLKEKHWN